MLKKILPIILLFSFILPNLAWAKLTSGEIFQRCSFLEKENDRAMSDKEIGSYIKKENECLKQELRKLIDLNVTNQEYKSQILDHLNVAEKANYDFLWMLENTNDNCNTNLGYDCGTIAKYLVADSQLQFILKMFIKLIVEIDNNRQAPY